MDQRVGILGDQLVVGRLAGKRNCVAMRVGTVAPAVQDCKNDRSVCHCSEQNIKTLAATVPYLAQNPGHPVRRFGKAVEDTAGLVKMYQCQLVLSDLQMAEAVCLCRLRTAILLRDLQSIKVRA